MPYQVNNPSGLGTVAAGAGPTDWSVPNNARFSDNLRAICQTTVFTTSRILKAFDWRFNIPATSEIRGIRVSVERNANFATGPRNVKDSGVFLYKNNVPLTSVNKADTATNWPTTNAMVHYGVSGVDLWGNNWTPADINSSGFGVGITVTITANTTLTANIDLILMTVFYAEKNKPDVVFESKIWNATNFDDSFIPMEFL